MEKLKHMADALAVGGHHHGAVLQKIGHTLKYSIQN
jgi:hypothetical protein